MGEHADLAQIEALMWESYRAGCTTRPAAWPTAAAELAGQQGHVGGG